MIDMFRNRADALNAAHEVGRDARGQREADPEAFFHAWLWRSVRNCGNLDVRDLKRAFGLGWQGKPLTDD